MPTTVLQIVSAVLTKIGETAVDSVDRNEASRLAASNVVIALRALADEYAFFTWLHNEYTVDDWVQHVATFPEDFLAVSYVIDRGGGYRVLTYVPERLFDAQELSSYVGEHGGACYYTYRGGKALFNPYPNDEVSRNLIRFNGALLPSVVPTDNQLVPVMTRDLNCLIFRVCMMMAVDHLKDSQLAQSYALEYGVAVRAAKQRMITDTTDVRRSMIF